MLGYLPHCLKAFGMFSRLKNDLLIAVKTNLKERNGVILNMYKVFYFLGCWFFHTIILAQDGATILSSFDSRLVQKGVFVSWTIKPGNFCLGLKLMRTNDTLRAEYVEVFVDPGICGEEDRSVTYTVFDSNATRGTTNFYRLILGFNPTHHISEYVPDSPETKMLIGPVPADHLLYLKFLTDNISEYELSIYNTLGRLMQKLKPNSNDLSIDVSEFESGMYVLQLSGPDSFQMRRKFLVY